MSSGKDKWVRYSELQQDLEWSKSSEVLYPAVPLAQKCCTLLYHATAVKRGNKKASFDTTQED